MKFFSKRACRSFQTFDGTEHFIRIDHAYRTHLEQIRSRLPENAYQLAQPSGMEHGLLVKVSHDRVRKRIRLVMRCGDLQVGYYNLIVTYIDAEITPKRDLDLAKIARTTKSCKDFSCSFIYQEIDLTASVRIVHRLIFHAYPEDFPDDNGYLWFEITCRRLRWRHEPKQSRRLPPISDRYPDGPVI